MYKQTERYPYEMYIRFLSQKMRHINDYKLAGYGLSASQAMLLEIIHQSSQSNIHVNRRFLQDAMNLSGPSVTNLLNGLEKNGYIHRGAGLVDGRTFQLQVTARGLDLISKVDQIFQGTEEVMLRNMAPEERQLLLKLLKGAYAALNAE